MTPLLTVAALAAAGLAGYAAGRTRPLRLAVDWADDQVARRPMWSPRFWLAVPVVLAAVAGLWLVHPRRTAANRRAFRDEQRAPVPVYDPNWAARRGPYPTLNGDVPR